VPIVTKIRCMRPPKAVPQPDGLPFSCGPKPAVTQMNVVLWFHARQPQALG
jgi:hypothetical protein